MQLKALAFLSILSILFFTGCDSKNENKDKTEVKEEKSNQKAIILKTTDNIKLNVSIEDNKIIFKDYPNKIVLVNFFATWCPPCKAEIPNLINLQNTFKNDFVVISVLLEQNKDNIELAQFIKNYNINYQVTNSKGNFLLSDAMGGITSIPTMFMLDKNSEIFQKYVGIVPVEMMETDIKKLLGK